MEKIRNGLKKLENKQVEKKNKRKIKGKDKNKKIEKRLLLFKQFS